MDWGDGTIALQAFANNLYVTCDLNNGGKLVVSRNSVGGAWGSFSGEYVTEKARSKGIPAACQNGTSRVGRGFRFIKEVPANKRSIGRRFFDFCQT